MKKLSAVIFDLDGTLLDSLNAWTEIDHHFFGRRGMTMPADYTTSIAHMTLELAADYTIKRFALTDSKEAVIEEWRVLALEEYALRVPLKPGAAEYIAALRTRGVRTAIATACREELCMAALRRHGLAHAFDCITYSEYTGIRKGTPEIYLHTAEALGVPPEECLVFEDLPDGVAGAAAAGMQTVGVLNDNRRHEWARLCALAGRVIHDFTEELPLL